MSIEPKHAVLTRTDREVARKAPLYLLLAATILLAVGGSAYWVLHNVVLVGRDAAGHLEQSIYAAKALAAGTLPGVFQAITRDEYRPPGLYLLTQPAYLIFGSSKDAAQVPNLIMLGGIILLTYVLARKVMGAWLSLLAAVLVALLPMIAAMARLYYMEVLLTTALLLAVLALLKSDGFARRSWTLALGGALGAMLLVKWTTPIYLFLPLLYVLWRHDFWVLQRRALLRPAVDWPRALLALAAAGALAFAWYWPNRTYAAEQNMLLGDALPGAWTLLWGATLYALSLRRNTRVANFWSAVLLALTLASLWYLPRIGFVDRLSEVAFGTDRGNQEAWDPLNLALYTRYLEFWVREHLGPLAAALILPPAFLGTLLLLRRWRHSPTGSTGDARSWGTLWRSGPEVLLVYWLLFGGSWLFLTLLAQANPRNLTPLVPVAAILLSYSLRAFARPLAVTIAGAWLAVLGTQWAMYTVDAGARLHAPAPQLWAAGDYLQWPATGSTDPGYWIHPAVLATVGSPEGEADSLGILVNTWEVNRGAFRYLAERDGQNLTIMTLTENENRGWSDVLANRWLLVKDGDNRNVAAQGRAVIDGIHFPEVHGYHLFHQLYTPAATYPLPDGDTVTLYHRAAGPRQPQDYPVILNETAPVAQNLNAWWSPGAAVIFDSADTAIWMGLHDVAADRIIIADETNPTTQAARDDLQGTVFVVSRNHEDPTRLAPADGYFARTFRAGTSGIDVYGKPSRPLTPLAVEQPWPQITISHLRSLPDVSPGGVLPLEIEVVDTVARPRKLSLRLVGADGTVVAQNDVPVETGREVRLGLFVPPTTLPGSYALDAVLYDPADLLPIPNRGGSESAHLATVTVAP